MKTRRVFLQTAAMAGAGILMPGATRALAGSGMSGGCGGGGCGGGSGTSIIDPPPGAPFADPPVMPNLSTTPGEVTVQLEAKITPVNVNGTQANLLTYNGCFPGPTIKVRSGDKLNVNFKNSLILPGTNILGHERDITNLHTHGLHVSPSGNSDNVMVMVMPGDSFAYAYDLSKEPPSTINFYHPHIHGSVAEQYWGGLVGALEVADATTALAGYETHLLLLKDITLSGTSPEPYSSMMDYMNGKEGNTVMVNGLVNPVLNIRPGQVQRWKIINASNARFYYLSLENHTLYVAGTEGGLLDKPYPVSSLLLSPGERVDLLVKASQTVKNYRLLALPYNRGCGGSASQQVTLMTMAYRGAATNDPLPVVVDPSARRLNATAVKTVQMALSMGQGKGYINGISFEMAGGTMKAFTTASLMNTCEIWQITNQSMMDHPFHQHVNPCQVLSVSGGNAGYASLYTKAPAWKDVVIVPRMGSVRLLVPVLDFDGMSMFHCHIVEHEDIGMMGLWPINCQM